MRKRTLCCMALAAAVALGGCQSGTQQAGQTQAAAETETENVSQTETSQQEETSGGQEDGSGAAGYKEGVYTAQAKGNNGDVKVEVEFSPDAIVKVTVTDHQETPGLSDPAIEKIPQRIVDGQTLNVDAVSGATNTSNAILEAVADCVTQAGGDAEGLKAKEAQSNTAVEEMDADVVVVGGGASGSGAALAAAGKGAKVVLLEKAAGVSGAGTMAGVMFADHSSLQKEAGKEVDTQWLYDQYITDSNYNANAALVTKVISESSATVEWLMENGVRLTLLDAGYGAQYNHKGMPTTAHGYADGGSAAIQTLHQRIEELGGQVLYETPGEELLFDAQGKVAGVAARKADGTTLNIHAKSVILATGGFGGNKEMMEEYFGEKAGTGLVGTATGDGIKMAWSAGAAEHGSHVAQWFGMKYDGAKSKEMPNGTGRLTELVRNPLLFVDKYGNRFGNEGEAYESAALGTMMYNLPDAKMYIVLDQGIVDDVAEKGLADVFVDRWAHFYGQGVSYVENGKTVDLDASTENLRTPRDYTEALEEAVAAGLAYKADSIEELEQTLGMDHLTETVNTYNQLCADQNDTQYHKDAHFLYAVDEGPYYVVETALRCLGTLGGVKINEQMQAVDEANKPIDNLYVVGADAGGMYGNSYVMFEGGTLGFAYISGRVAGENAADHAAGQ